MRGIPRFDVRGAERATERGAERGWGEPQSEPQGDPQSELTTGFFRCPMSGNHLSPSNAKRVIHKANERARR